jgi:hypothetical protein
MIDRDLERLLERCHTAEARNDLPAPPFDIAVALADGYDQLLARNFKSDDVSVTDLLKAAQTAGRLLLSAPAARGKTTLTHQLARAALQAGQVAIRVDLRRWTPSLDQRWLARRDTDAGRMELLLNDVAHPAVSEGDLAVASEVGCLVVVDGLNEIPAGSSQAVPWVLDAFAARRPFASVVVCDRLQRRTLPSDQWSLATITKVTDRRRPNLPSRSALMLDIGGPEAATHSNEAKVLLAYISDALGELGITDLPEAALAAYEHQQSRYIPIGSLTSAIGRERVECLLGNGLLRADGDYVYFRHHLFHDALGASAAVAEPDRWDSQLFDALTFKANSFDAIGLALELLDQRAQADRFLTAVYNWNQYASAYALSHGRQLSSVCVSGSLELAMLAVLSERRWDSVAPTVERVEDALRVFPGELARRLLKADDIGEIHTLVADSAASLDEPTDWLETFLGNRPTVEMVAALAGDELAGWMAANALRDADLSDSEASTIVRAMGHPQRSVRWRAAHALGGHASKRAAQRLLKAIDQDEDGWVRYGAIRSLIDQAGRADDKLRTWILRQVQKRAAAIRADHLVRGELEKALQLREPPMGWATAVEPLVMEMFTSSPTVPDQDHWRRVGRRVTDSVRVARASVT